MRNQWTKNEITILLNAYFNMLACQLKGEKYNKRKILQDTLAKLPGRGKGGYEYKVMTISAACESLGLPYVKGYKPYYFNVDEWSEIIKDHLQNYHYHGLDNRFGF